MLGTRLKRTRSRDEQSNVKRARLMDAFGRLNLADRMDDGTSRQHASAQDSLEDDLFEENPPTNDESDFMDTSNKDTIFIPSIERYLEDNPDPVDIVPGQQNGQFEILPTEPPTPDILARISQRHFQKVLDGYTHESLVVYQGGPQRVVWDRFCRWWLGDQGQVDPIFSQPENNSWPQNQPDMFNQDNWSHMGTRHNSEAVDYGDNGDMDVDMEEDLPGYTFYGTSDFTSPDTVVGGNDPDYMMDDDIPMDGTRRNSLH